jgi:hypothetical protein
VGSRPPGATARTVRRIWTPKNSQPLPPQTTKPAMPGEPFQIQVCGTVLYQPPRYESLREWTHYCVRSRCWHLWLMPPAARCFCVAQSG